MPRFGGMQSELGSSEVSPPRQSDAPYANPDKLVLPKGMELSSTESANLVDSIKTKMENERIDRYKDANCPPGERFEGERGNSLCLPDETTQTGREAKAWLEEHGIRGIEYHNGYPVFSEIAVETVEIPNMTADRGENYKQAYKAVAEKWNAEGRDGRTDWKPSDIKAWKTDNDLVIHENQDMKTCEFLPVPPHAHYSHIGGRLICAIKGIFSERQMELMQQRSDFNEQFDA